MSDNALKRSSVRTAITKLESSIVVKLSKDDITADEVECLIATCDLYEKQVRELDDIILSELAAKGTETEFNLILSYQEKLVEVRTRCHLKLLKINKPLINIPNHDTIANASPSSNSKLEKIAIDKFNGDVAKWCSWWEQYCQHVHLTNMPIRDKFYYLRKALCGRAKKQIESISTEERFYQLLLIK